MEISGVKETLHASNCIALHVTDHAQENLCCKVLCGAMQCCADDQKALEPYCGGMWYGSGIGIA